MLRLRRDWPLEAGLSHQKCLIYAAIHCVCFNSFLIVVICRNMSIVIVLFVIQIKLVLNMVHFSHKQRQRKGAFHICGCPTLQTTGGP